MKWLGLPQKKQNTNNKNRKKNRKKNIEIEILYKPIGYYFDRRTLEVRLVK